MVNVTLARSIEKINGVGARHFYRRQTQTLRRVRDVKCCECDAISPDATHGSDYTRGALNDAPKQHLTPSAGARMAAGVCVGRAVTNNDNVYRWPRNRYILPPSMPWSPLAAAAAVVASAAECSCVVNSLLRLYRSTVSSKGDSIFVVLFRSSPSPVAKTLPFTNARENAE